MPMEQTLKQWLKRIKLHESSISMILGFAVVLVIGILVYNYFARVNKPEEQSSTEVAPEYKLEIVEEEGKMIPQGLPVEHVVSTKEHLWGISEKYYGNGYNWIDIAKENNLTNPSIIISGQKLIIPRVELRFLPKSKTTITTNLEPITSDSYTVVKGDSLWKIAVRAYQDGYAWPKIYQANQSIIRNPGLIEPGWVLSIPR